MKKGKLIVFEGSDGAGKTTQLALLVGYFKKQHIPYATFDFPQYYKTFFGKWVGKFLKGEYGKVEDLHPYLLMFPYAADRWMAKKEIEEALGEGKIIVTNRYATSCAYQAAKLPVTERDRFTRWDFEMEYEAFGIPREDLVIFLYVPYQIAQNLISAKNKRKYLGEKQKDIHEGNLKLMREVEKVYLEYAKKYHHWVKIDCTKNGEILPREKIHQLVLDALRRKKIM